MPDEINIKLHEDTNIKLYTIYQKLRLTEYEHKIICNDINKAILFSNTLIRDISSENDSQNIMNNKFLKNIQIENVYNII